MIWQARFFRVRGSSLQTQGFHPPGAGWAAPAAAQPKLGGTKMELAMNLSVRSPEGRLTQVDALGMVYGSAGYLETL